METIESFRDMAKYMRAQKRPLSRIGSDASLNTGTTSSELQSSLNSEVQKNAPYIHPTFELQMKGFGSFMDKSHEGITAESKKLCDTLQDAPQLPPEHTLFSDDELLEKTLSRMRGANKPKVVRDIVQLIVPSAEILATRGAKHLEILRETTNACWVNSHAFIYPSDLRSGLRPQPDFGLGFKRGAFSREQLQRLQIFIGDPLTDISWIAPTYDMYFPFLSSEVQSGSDDLNIADLQNAYTQFIALGGLYKFFSLVGRENELHREINGFSISHSEMMVRIWGHYIVIEENEAKFYRRPIAQFSILPMSRQDERWTAYTFVKNIYDLWVPEHFKRICSVIDMLPADLN
ncbi:hypothetical protein OCU04_009346 [Sclerotinia nivalis]|uniref:DUF7924 domain-containing protein n=1 Tax=Sclerotinia nivalis TaxID=352851 RepID=A0A9X0DI12_9HELO|nr:hypothetical protein OCU04_009346 [Sclerotinia nivalis]